MKRIIAIAFALLLTASVSFAAVKNKPIGGGGDIPIPFFKNNEQVEAKGRVLKKLDISICTTKPLYKFRFDGNKEVDIAAKNDEVKKSLDSITGKKMPVKIYGKFVEEKEMKCKYVLVDKAVVGPGK